MTQRAFQIAAAFSILLILTSTQSADKPKKLISIPTQTLNLYKILGDDQTIASQTINAFEISNFVTYGEYKEYLAAIKIDSSERYYLSQLPDSSIAPKEIYERYVNSSEFDNDPVLGISWDNAMNFCRWKTLLDNPTDSLTFIYRLPKGAEWIAAYHFLEGKHAKKDFNQKYSDWLLSAHYEGHFGMDLNDFVYDDLYFHKSTYPQPLKRKNVIGDSFAFQKAKLGYYYSLYYYADEGYRHIAFRYVKVDKKDSKQVLEYWGLQNR